MKITLSKHNNPFQPYTESSGEMAFSPFLNVYKNAARAVEEILRSSSFSGGEINNLIAFTGEQGTGKTSAMLSFAGSLSEGRFPGEPLQLGTKFIPLPIIEQSQISGRAGIIEAVISHLYKQFEILIQTGFTGNYSQEQLRRIYSCFESAYRAVRELSDVGIPSETSHTSLGLPAEPLKECVKSLISEYLRLCGGNDKNYLVVTCDNIDGDIAAGYKICDDLQKHLSVPGVIILVSFDTEKLTRIIHSHYSSLYNTLLIGNERSDVQLGENLMDLTAKYVNKIFPFARRCIMPRVGNSASGTLYICYIDKPDHTAIAEDEMLNLIFKKTGLILPKNKYGSHELLPTTLRGCVELITLLRNMKSVTIMHRGEVYFADADEQNILFENLELFERYILESASGKLRRKSRDILRQVAASTTDKVNYTFLHLIARELGTASDEQNAKFSMQSKILSSETLPENVKIDSVFAAADYYCRSVHGADGGSELFTEALNAIYSIKVLRILFGKVRGEADLTAAKDTLYKLLGLMEFEDLEFEKLGFRCTDQPIITITPSAETLDLVLAHTYCVGKLHGRGQNRHGMNITRDVLKNGNSDFQYFSENMLASVTSILRSDLEFESEEYKESLRSWQEKYLSPLPIFSVNMLYHILSDFESRTAFDRTVTGYGGFVDTMKAILADNLTRTAIGKSCADIIAGAAEEFPFWKNQVKAFPFFIEKFTNGTRIVPFHTENIAAAAPPPEFSPPMQTPAVQSYLGVKMHNDSEEITFEKIENAIMKFGGVRDWDTLKKTRGVDTKGKRIRNEHVKILKRLNSRIAPIKQNALDKPHTDANLIAAREELLAVLQSARAEFLVSATGS